MLCAILTEFANSKIVIIISVFIELFCDYFFSISANEFVSQKEIILVYEYISFIELVS